ncbi:MAG TPA: sigma-70 family RNA polymerase sigma factor [Candidatus Dormibacteraeota bacterium]|nr:sigma-70 family RNA polymerase sigma factor [Candidatus Dormibacteraeota bacterium]
MDDEALLDQARHGDSGAFTALVERYQDELYTMALRLLGTPADAADVVQETFLRAYMNLPRLRHASVRAWLFRVAVNASRDVQRRAVRRPADSLEQDDGKVLELPSQEMGPEAAAEAKERAEAIRAAVMQLPLDYRVAVVLRDVNDLSYEEIAEALRVPLGTVKSRLSRARLQLADALRGSAVLFTAEGRG